MHQNFSEHKFEFKDALYVAKDCMLNFPSNSYTARLILVTFEAKGKGNNVAQVAICTWVPQVSINIIIRLIINSVSVKFVNYSK